MNARKSRFMKRRNNETVDEFLTRRKIIYDEYDEYKRAERAAAQKEDKEAHKAYLKQQYPGYKVTDKGLHFACVVCGKHYVAGNPSSYDDGFICDKCRRYKELEANYPDHKIKDGKVEFTCEQCREKFFYMPWQPFKKEKKQFCSDYCSHASKLKRPPVWNRDEWEKIQEWDREREEKESFGGFNSFFNFEEPDQEFNLGNPQEDANQEALFGALVDYFDYWNNPHYRLNAIHNVVKKLRRIANDAQMETVKEDELEELRSLTAPGYTDE